MERALVPATVTSGGSALVAWMQNVDVYIDFLAGIIAVVAGIFAIAVAIQRLRRGRTPQSEGERKNNDTTDKEDIQSGSDKVDCS